MVYGDIYEIIQPIFDWLSYCYPSDEATLVITRSGAKMFINHGPVICNEKAWDDMKKELPNMVARLADCLKNKEVNHAASNEEIERN